jgi:Tfp pilus assembly protein FimT
MLVAVAIGALIIMIAVPAFRTMMDRQRLDTATRQMVNDLWNARSKAVSTGWEYKVIGFGNASTDTKKNQYRLLGRSSSAVAWPADTVATFTSATQSASAWTNLSTLQEGIQFTPGGGGTNARFEIAFNPAGGLSVNSGDFNPFTMTVKGTTKTIRVSVVGGVTAQ